MQIVCGGKVSRLHDLFAFRGKTFTIVQQFETPCNRKAKKIAGKPSRLEANPRKFSTADDLHYTVFKSRIRNYLLFCTCVTHLTGRCLSLNHSISYLNTTCYVSDGLMFSHYQWIRSQIYSLLLMFSMWSVITDQHDYQLSWDPARPCN